MQGFVDFLSFKTFISPYVLLAFYYIGALGVPIGSWLFALWIKRKYWVVSDAYETGKEVINAYTPVKYRILFFSLFIFCFICMEIFWRMMFEFMLAYLQMRDALMILVAQ
ncbi:MAG TPA: DUF4282 domain-containing protein [Gammaproteobacteria bacterium]|nr:DUF4282 domain-containing protein [Gammaproteobacteria bacterium]